MGERFLDLDQAVIVAAGSNLPDGFPSSRALLEAALSRLPGLGMMVRKRSAWWSSAAWPDPSDPAYLNGIVIVETRLPPRSVLGALLGLEAAFGRQRAAANAPRALDLDLIAHGRQTIEEPGLRLPHPRAAARLFVMGPLAEIAPDWIHPGCGTSARDLAARAIIGRDARPVRSG